MCSTLRILYLGNIIIYKYSQVQLGKAKEYCQRWKKLTKYYTQNFETKKLAHKICAKNAQNVTKLAKMAKSSQKRPKTFNKMREKKQKLPQL